MDTNRRFRKTGRSQIAGQLSRVKEMRPPTEAA
jgi:hypothetical protein